MDLRSLARVEDPVIGFDGVERRDVHRRSHAIKTVFGTVDLDRERFQHTGIPGFAPLDAELNLPPERASLELRRRVARLAARMSFEDVVDEIRATTGTQLVKRQVEATRKAAEQSAPKLLKRRSKGEKAHRKRMAAVAAVYSIGPSCPHAGRYCRGPWALCESARCSSAKATKQVSLGKHQGAC